ncbi:hypothetical protein HDV00_005741 [Rhizophlyctis rosea]|nr:hypothetical protein HDV00_005741 [Rhizophlyctis rosea]
MEATLPFEFLPNIVRVCDPIAGRNLRATCRKARALIVSDDLVFAEAGWRYATKGYANCWAWALRTWQLDVLFAYLPKVPGDALGSAIKEAVSRVDEGVLRRLIAFVPGNVTSDYMDKVAQDIMHLRPQWEEAECMQPSDLRHLGKCSVIGRCALDTVLGCAWPWITMGQLACMCVVSIQLAEGSIDTAVNKLLEYGAESEEARFFLEAARLACGV